MVFLRRITILYFVVEMPMPCGGEIHILYNLSAIFLSFSIEFFNFAAINLDYTMTYSVFELQKISFFALDLGHPNNSAACAL